MELSKQVQVRKVLAYASGTADRTGDAIDMQNFEGVMFIVPYAAIAAGHVGGLKVQQSSDDGSVDAYGDLEGSALAVADDDDNQVFVIDVYRPEKRYVKLIVDNDASNATAQTAVAVQYGPRKLPVAGSIADEVTVETHVSPAEGTA